MNEQPRTPRRAGAEQTNPTNEETFAAGDDAIGSKLTAAERGPTQSGERRTMEVREEQLVPRRETRELGDVRIRKEVEQVSERLEVDALREEVEIEHVPVGEVVEDRKAPWQEDDALVVPVYEERLVLVKCLVLKEQLRVRRRQTTERHVLEEPVLRERVVIDDTTGRNVVQERATGDQERAPRSTDEAEAASEERDGPLARLARKLLE